MMERLKGGAARWAAVAGLLWGCLSCGQEPEGASSAMDLGGEDMGAQPDGGDVGGEAPCMQGFLGCSCIDGVACYPGSEWVCLEGECRLPVCAAGAEGCVCYANNTCDADEEGRPLLCDGGLCERQPEEECAAGALGCACREGQGCEEGLECGFFGGRVLCGPPDCKAGAEGCPCGDGDTCQGALLCVQGGCLQPACRPGAQDCYCRADLGCDEGLRCDPEERRCAPIPCTPGSVGCTCDEEGGCAAADARCTREGLCEAVDCPNGAEGCACQEGECVVTAEGVRLLCEEGVCRRPECAPGAPGCACQGGVRCQEGAECVEGVCALEDCVSGSLHCECAGGLCQAGLRCREDNLCVDGTGWVNNPCREDRSCERGARCAEGGVCRRCTLGVPGCQCDDADGCLTGAVCVAGVCVAEADVPPRRPEEPRCYSHCQGDLEAEGRFVACGPDGLMEACADGRSCQDGSCLLEGEEAPRCASELDCPEWQTCAEGRCYSECEADQECPSGKRCDRHVCRVPCESDGEACPRGQHCQTSDGQSGFCLPNHPESGEPAEQVPGNFALSANQVTFSNTAVTARLALFNNSRTTQRFEVRKVRHLLQFSNGTAQRAVRAADGRIECDPMEDADCACAPGDRGACFCAGPGCVCRADSDCEDSGHRCQLGACRPTGCSAESCPLFWLSMGQGREAGDARVQEAFEVSVAPGGSAELVLSRAAETEGVRWEGAVDVVNKELGTQRVDLLYNEVPEGQWAGEMVYLATFGTRDLEKWRFNQATRSGGAFPGPNGPEAVVLNNALLTRWQTFRAGDISWDEMQAVLRSVESGSWGYANVQEACPTDIGACYLFDINRDGVQILSNDLAAQPIPSGVVELPIALNLRMRGERSLEGRIESSKALHYAGQPAVRLEFLESAQGCSSEGPVGTCVAFLEALEAEILVGGRYLTGPEDARCGERPDGSYALWREPWLVPGFTQGTSLDAESGQRYRYECRDTRLPLQGADAQEQEALAPLNQSLTLSNPIPDGRARKRSLRLVDGALINQSQLLIFFEERFESFLGGEGEEDFSAYGYMVLQRRATDLEADDADGDGVADVYQGATAEDERAEPADLLAPRCEPGLLQEIVGGNGRLTRSNLSRVVSTLINGVSDDAQPQPIGPGTQEQVHYFCEDTGLFDGGPANTTPSWTALANNDSCRLANDGACDDGGPQSETALCALGTDQSDCPARVAADLDERVACPAGSRVEFFTVNQGRLSQEAVAGQPCQADGSCQETLNRWRQSGQVVQSNPSFRCADPAQVFCDQDRLDLRNGKVFYTLQDEVKTFVQIHTLIEEAFRYKSRFQNREGQGIGFTPSICVPGSDATPYCYDPAQIEELEARVDCLLHIHQGWYDDFGVDARGRAARQLLDEFLRFSFSLTEERSPYLPLPILHDGFERQYAELMIMQGDESFTRAFSSRFDLAGVSAASFEGSLLEPGGINLSGAAGYEMFSLYQSAQYFQKVQDRFFTMSPVFWDATRYGVGNTRNFVTAETVLRYFDRVIRASTQKARAWSEIARRYQHLGRPDLARAVAERAYTATYLESIIMSRMMLQVLEGSTLAENRGQIERSIEEAQVRYKAAMVDMQSVYSTISDNLTIFGFEPDYIPFPALDTADFRQSNAFEVLLLRSRNRLQFAREREEIALSQGREFETNQAQFQSELTQIRNTYEGQLAEICGTFVVGGEDADPNNDRVYPATRKYAHLDELATFFGDPCGLLGNGQLFQAMGQLENMGLEAQSLQVQFENVLSEVEIERDRVSAQCGEILEAADFLYGKCDDGPGDEAAGFFTDPFLPVNQGGCIQAQINDLRRDISISQFTIGRLGRLHQSAATYANLTKCFAGPIGTDCTNAAFAAVKFGVATFAVEAGIAVTEATILQRETQIAELDRFRMKWQTEQECDRAQIESEARVRSMLLRLRELELESLRLEHRMRLAFSEIDRLRNQAKRLEAQQTEAEQLSINIQAAHNNPNVRIYKNDAIINAELSFDDAIAEIYKLTRVFEYYTSTSYANKADLFLIRTVSRGALNLENYLNELESAFYEFEEFFGQPATRVHIISLKNDVLAIPYTAPDGSPYSDAQRTQLMRSRLTDPALLDRSGYISLPFSTSLEQLSPLTRNHKLLYVEADLYGNDTGDLIGRIYLRQRGTSVINSVEGEKQFFRFDERTAVLNTIFGGVRFFDNSIYQSYRMRDRPFVNTQWELIINQRDEAVNQDINLNALTDVRLYVYYTDVTVF